MHVILPKLHLTACFWHFISSHWCCCIGFGKVQPIKLNQSQTAEASNNAIQQHPTTSNNAIQLNSIMQLTPIIAIHMSAALGAVATGPIALWARKGQTQRPRLHRAFGYAWVTLMVVTALSALFIRDFRLPNIAGFTPIHLFVPFALLGLTRAFQALVRGQIALHQKLMTRTYINACLLAGVFTFLPGRYLGSLLWSKF